MKLFKNILENNKSSSQCIKSMVLMQILRRVIEVLLVINPNNKFKLDKKWPNKCMILCLSCKFW